VGVSLEREPLRLDAAVLLRIAAERLVPAAAGDVESRGVDLMLLDEQAFDFTRAFLAELDRLQRHLPDELIATAFAEVFDERVIDVPAEQNRRAGADGKQAFDCLEVLQVLLVREIEIARVWREEESDVFAQQRIGFDRPGRAVLIGAIATF
jgi:hypothetical protein